VTSCGKAGLSNRRKATARSQSVRGDQIKKKKKIDFLTGIGGERESRKIEKSKIGQRRGRGGKRGGTCVEFARKELTRE